MKHHPLRNMALCLVLLGAAPALAQARADAAAIKAQKTAEQKAQAARMATLVVESDAD